MQGLLHGTSLLRKQDTLDESMGSLVLDDNLVSSSKLEVRVSCTCIEDLDSFVGHVLPTTREAVPNEVDLVVSIKVTVEQAA